MNLIKIIDGKVYNTETATVICDVTPLRARSLGKSDFSFEDTQLYRSPKGQFFISGEGGANSRWSLDVSPNERTSGYGLQLVDLDEAKYMVEIFADNATFEGLFGKPEID